MKFFVFSILLCLESTASVLVLQPFSSLRAEDSFQRLAVRLEQRLGGRLGVVVLDTGTGKKLEFRAEERFPMCSTFKPLLAAAVLQRVEQKLEQPERRIPFGSADLLEWAPVTRSRVAEGAMTVVELCRAIIEQSDNTAANLLLDSIGGPAGFTTFVRGLGDAATRLDRNEPTLNEARPGDDRDTTTPAAMLASMRHVLLGEVLGAESRLHLLDWMKNSTTGLKRIRAGLPAGWAAGDKTGTGLNGTSNDIAIFWPPDRPPVMIMAFTTASPLSGSEREKILVELGRAVAEIVIR